MFQNVIGVDLFELVVVEWIGENVQIVNDIGTASRVNVQSDERGKVKLIRAADLMNLLEPVISCTKKKHHRVMPIP